MTLPRFALLLLLCCQPALAAVERLELRSITPVADGRAFGRVGPYEKVVGRLHFALDPTAPGIVDLERAPRAEDGRVHFAADVYLLRPTRAERGNE